MGIQTITTPAGEEMVILPRAEYEALVADAEDSFEDGADAATFAASIAAMQPQDILPANVSAAILAGAGRVRAFREWRGMTAAQLAGAASLSPNELDEIEQGRRILSREAAAQVSLALDLPVGWLAV